METSGGGAHNWNLVVFGKGRMSVWHSVLVSEAEMLRDTVMSFFLL